MFNFCIERGKHVVAVIKGDQKVLLQGAQGLFANMKPGLWDEPRRQIRFWDVEGFTSAEAVKKPLRVLHTEERMNRRERIGKKWIETLEDHRWWWATTFPLSQLPSRQLCCKFCSYPFHCLCLVAKLLPEKPQASASNPSYPDWPRQRIAPERGVDDNPSLMAR